MSNFYGARKRAVFAAKTNKAGDMTNIVDVMGARQYNECTDVWEESDMLADLAQKYFLDRQGKEGSLNASISWDE